MKSQVLLAAAVILPVAAAEPSQLVTPAVVDLGQAHHNAGPVLLDSFVSFSIEFVFFPDFVGNSTHPNSFTRALLDNIAEAQGSKPVIRVGGNTQDYALYDADLTHTPYVGVVDPSRSPDYPTTVTIGPGFFDSYRALPAGYRYIHGFNLAKGGNSSIEEGWQTLLDTAPLACEAISDASFYLWEYGNEPDSYSVSAQGPVRDRLSWDEAEYVRQWSNGTAQIRKSFVESCPEVARPRNLGFIAPSFAGFANPLKAKAVWEAGLAEETTVKHFSSHKYIAGAESPGVTLEGTLMNHTRTTTEGDAVAAIYNEIYPLYNSNVPHVLGEVNSLYNQGRPGLSDSFGAALWGLDFNLYAASIGIKRVHMHMGLDYRYASWQPRDTDDTPKGTKAPYYGNIATAAFVSSLGGSDDKPAIAVAHIPLPQSDGRDSAYTAYHLTADESDTRPPPRISRLAVINMVPYNSTKNGHGLELLKNEEKPPRGARAYTFTLRTQDPDDDDQTMPDRALVQRLIANGSDAVTGVTWSGFSYAAELHGGLPVLLPNSTLKAEDRVLPVVDGEINIEVPDSSAVVLTFFLPGQEIPDRDDAAGAQRPL